MGYTLAARGLSERAEAALSSDTLVVTTAIDAWNAHPGILGLAGGLNLSVTGEGIGTAAQHPQLRELGCERGQGFLFAKHLDAAALAGLIASKFTLSADADPGDRAAA